MKLHIAHDTRYLFTGPAHLNPHVLRFRPSDSRTQRLLSFRLDVNPLPAGYTDNYDAAGNETRYAWFQAPVSEFSIRAESIVETFPDDRAGFIIFPYESVRLPVVYRPDDEAALAPYLLPVSDDAALHSFANAAAAASGGRTMEFVQQLIRAVHDRIEYTDRESGDPLPPGRTLSLGKGSCRDQVVLAMALLRLKGIAARFVSGYQYIRDKTLHELHAWVEVFLPGGGWLGFDPTTGIATDERYVRIAAGADPATTMPVAGTFGGAGELSLITEIRISRG